MFMRWFETKTTNDRRKKNTNPGKNSSGSEYSNAQSSFCPVVNNSLQPLFINCFVGNLLLLSLTPPAVTTFALALHIYV